MYSIYLTKNNIKLRIKSYPFKIQCTIWLYLQGWVFSGMDDWTYENINIVSCPTCPDAKVEIVKEEDSRV